MPQLEVWFQRASDVVRKLSYGDMDLGIVGLDMFAELSHDDPDLVVVHDSLDFGHCHLGLGVPMGGKFTDISTLDQLRSMPEWSESNPLRVVTGYQNVARKFFQEKGFEHVVLLSADGALEAAPLMGSADIILDLVSTGAHLHCTTSCKHKCHVSGVNEVLGCCSLVVSCDQKQSAACLEYAAVSVIAKHIAWQSGLSNNRQSPRRCALSVLALTLCLYGLLTTPSKGNCEGISSKGSIRLLRSSCSLVPCVHWASKHDSKQ